MSCVRVPRLIAHMAPDAVAANSFGGMVLLILIVMSGYTIVRGALRCARKGARSLAVARSEWNPAHT
jgi:hypothetical protein